MVAGRNRFGPHRVDHFLHPLNLLGREVELGGEVEDVAGPGDAVELGRQGETRPLAPPDLGDLLRRQGRIAAVSSNRSA